MKQTLGHFSIPKFPASASKLGEGLQLAESSKTIEDTAETIKNNAGTIENGTETIENSAETKHLNSTRTARPPRAWQFESNSNAKEKYGLLVSETYL